ncbi:MAG: PAS domain S-box protein, partial [Desulfobacterales bacterium]|nr:PAS domain S-box protein [Desulfobacterales bacterium]
MEQNKLVKRRHQNLEDQANLLIVDNDIEFVKDLEKSLNAKGYSIDCVHGKKEALEKLKQSNVHVIILNIGIDEPSGIYLLDQLNLISPRTLCIAIGDHNSTQSAIESMQKGAYDFIQKPFDMSELYSSLERCFDRIKLEKDKASFEIALLEAEERYRTLVETMNDGLCILDKSRLIVYANDSLCKIIGYSVDELIGKGVSIFFDVENQKRFAKYLENLEKGEHGSFEIFMKGKSSKVIPAIFSTQQILDSNGDFDGSFAVITDITEQIQSKEKIQESEVKYRSLFEESLDAIVIATRGGKFLDVNRAAYKLLGYTKNELMGIPVQQIYENMDALLTFQQEIEDNGYAKDHMARLRKKDGTLMDCVVTANIHKEKNDIIMGYQAIVRDVTEKKRLENQILQAQKMDSIGTLAGGIAHDFNNLLMGMRGKASLMLFKIDSTHPHYEKLKTIEQLIDSASSLTKQLLDFARGGKFEMKTAEVNEIIQRSSNMFGRTKKAIKIHNNFQKNTWTVNVDQGQIEQVLLNMYVNAAQAMPKGGNIFISSENMILDESFVKPFQVKPGKYVKISIKDNGIGMDEKIIQKIFDPFFTTKKAEKGSGLGLSTAYGIIKKHGGIIDVSSEKDKGSTFDIYLKVSEKHFATEEKIHLSALTGNESVLVVDDEQVIVEHIKEMLETLGYEVFTTLKGNKAIEIYEKKQDSISIVVL